MNLVELAAQAGLNPKRTASTHGGEYKSACPTCGGKDRFIIHPYKQKASCLGSYWCRQCGIYGDTVEFCRKFLGLSFQEAVIQANATIPTKQFLPYEPVETEKRRTLQPRVELPPHQWIAQATAFLMWTHKQIWHHPTILKQLEERGIPNEAVKLYQIGFNPTNLTRNKHGWGIEQEGSLFLPKGIVIPTFDNGRLVRLKIRRTEWYEQDNLPKYMAITSSMNGLNIIGDTNNQIMVIVESELDAYALHYAAKSLVFVVAVGSNIKNPDSVTDYLAKQKQYLLICHDNDEAGQKMLLKWQSFYPHAKAYPSPIGKDIGEAVKQGLNINAWITTALPKQPNTLEAWNSEDKALINWVLSYISERTVTRASYAIFEREIASGPNSPRARTGELQKGLRLMKQLVERAA